ncbi:MAG TPA: M13 family metallopeptidase [Thermoanaerobaculia bacterium]|nr:M13 family metallopeptidase [Thermoanaerobaculia bacterium]
MKRTLFIAALLLAACATNPPAQPTTQPAAQQKPLFGEHGFDVAQIDRSVEPCDDFYRFAVGKWREAHPLPPQYSRFGRFEELAERNRETLRDILQEDAKLNGPLGSNEQKIGDFWKSCMNEPAIEAEGWSPIAPELKRIDAVSNLTELQNEIARLQSMGYAPVFRVSGQQDYKNSKSVIAFLSQGGLGLPDRDYYLRDDKRFADTRSQYVDHMAKMFQLTGEDAARATEDAKQVLDFETKLARSSMSRIETRSPEATYHITPVAELVSMTPNLDFAQFLKAVGINQQSVNVAHPKFFQNVSEMIKTTPLDAWKAYLRWRVVDTAAPTLSKAFVDEDFAFGSVISGQKEIQPRWQRCVRAADSSIGQLLGQEYVKRRFTPEAKAKMNALIDNLVGALRSDIPTLSWMGPETKQAALTKLAAFARRIGYPDQWRDYSALQMTPNSYAQNLINAREFAFQRGIARIGKPDDPNEWGFFTPATVNASYQPSRNDITFPAGILQPPFYDPNADDAYNYGGIGVVIGHEMTHGFDDQGAKFDPNGNLRNWWTEADLKNFESRAECIANEYSEFNVVPGVNIQGKLVLGEAIADLGGATIALAAYEHSLAGKQRQTIDGFTPEQRFFLGFAQVWGENIAPQEATRRALSDPHAQGPFRVNGTVSNMPAFQKAFGCNTGTKMVRAEDKRCAIW